MLALSLEKLALQKQEFDVHIYLDTCTEEKLDEVQYVRDKYFPTALIFRAQGHVYAPSGSWNILNAIKGGYESGADFVCLVEEDVMVRPNYMEYHEKWHSLLFSEPVALCGRLIEKYGRDYYTNPGSSLSRSLLDCIVPHINNEFFADRVGYLSEHFPDWPEASPLDDGLIRRVIKQVDGRIYFPDKPVAVHQGFSGYQKIVGYKTEGSIEDRIAQLRTILEKVDPNARYFADFEPYDFNRAAG